jgi:hypothetical protein
MRLHNLITKLTADRSGITRVAVVALAVLAFGTASPSCFADVVYVFSGNITPYFFLPNGAAQSFSYEAPNFITQDTFVPASALSECSTGYSAICGGINFLPSSPGFGVPGQVVQIAFMDGVVNPNYYFPLAAFTADGTYSAVVFAGANTGTLTVTETPEPGPAFLLMGPLAILFLAQAYRWSRRKRGLIAGSGGLAESQFVSF